MKAYLDIGGYFGLSALIDTSLYNDPSTDLQNTDFLLWNIRDVGPQQDSHILCLLRVRIYKRYMFCLILVRCCQTYNLLAGSGFKGPHPHNDFCGFSASIHAVISKF